VQSPEFRVHRSEKVLERADPLDRRNVRPIALLSGFAGDLLPPSDALSSSLIFTMVRSVTRGMTEATPSSVAFCTIQSILSDLGRPCPRMTAGEAAFRSRRRYLGSDLRFFDRRDPDGVFHAPAIEQDEQVAGLLPEDRADMAHIFTMTEMEGSRT